MGKIAERLQTGMGETRPVLYGDNVKCNKVTECSFGTYILDNNANADVLDRVMRTDGITTIVAPTGSGKSHSLVERARVLVKENPDCKVILALPGKVLTLQLGKQKNIYSMVGGDDFDEDSPIICTTYEKMFEVENFVRMQRALNQKCRIVAILDEAHLLTTQYVFRNEAILQMIRCIEHRVFDSTLLVTATPEPLSLFRCDEIVEFKSKGSTSAIQKLKIVEVDDVTAYIKNLDYKKKFPFIRLNSKSKIEELIKDVPFHLVRLSSEDKKSKAYLDIVNDSRIDSNVCEGICSTSVIEAGVNITSYDSDRILPMAVFHDNNISANDIEQFLNRIRRCNGKQVEYAEVVIKKSKEKDIKVSLISLTGTTLCEFTDLLMDKGDITIRDTDKINNVADGKYKLKVEIGTVVRYQDFIVSSQGITGMEAYSKVDCVPILLQGIGFRKFIEILKVNDKCVEQLKKKLQKLVEALFLGRQSKQIAEQLDEDVMQSLQLDDELLVEQMTKAALEMMGQLKECLTYADGQIVVDKRALFMLSYRQYQAQYYYYPDVLKEELEERMNIPVEVTQVDTDKKKSKRNVNNIWEGVEHLADEVLKGKLLFDDIVNYYPCFGTYQGKGMYLKKTLTTEFREQDLLMELLESLHRFGIPGDLIMQILGHSKTKSKVTQYKNAYHVLKYNDTLNRVRSHYISDIPICVKEDKVQAAIFCYMKQKGNASYVINEKLIQGIIALYKESYPLGAVPTDGAVEHKIWLMYKKKDKNTVLNELRLDVKDIFKLVKADR